jgi:hypothetical protein
MRQIAIILILALLIAAQGTAEASNFQISFGYGDDDGPWKVTRYKQESYRPGRYSTRYPVYTAYSWPQVSFLGYTYAPATTRHCYMATDKYGRKFRKCVWVRDSECQCRSSCGLKHGSSCQAIPYGQAKRYCCYK